MSDIREPSEAYTSSPTLNGDHAPSIVSSSPKKAKSYPLPDTQAGHQWDKLRKAVVSQDSDAAIGALVPPHDVHPEPRIPEDETYDGSGHFLAIDDAPVVAVSPVSTHLELPKTQDAGETASPVGLGLDNAVEPGTTVSTAVTDGAQPEAEAAMKTTVIAESIDGGEPVGVNVGSKRMFQLSKRFSEINDTGRLAAC